MSTLPKASSDLFTGPAQPPCLFARPPPGGSPKKRLSPRAAARHKARGGPSLPARTAVSYLIHIPPSDPKKRNPV